MQDPSDEDKDFLEEFKKIKVVQRCPRCGKLTLRYVEGTLACSRCLYRENFGEL